LFEFEVEVEVETEVELKWVIVVVVVMRGALDWFVGGSSGADVRRDWRRVADVRDAWADEEDEEEGEEEREEDASVSAPIIRCEVEVATGLPKGVSWSLSFEEDATVPVPVPVGEWRGRAAADCGTSRALLWSLRRWCDDRWLGGGTVRNCPEVDMVCFRSSALLRDNVWTLYYETHVEGEVREKHADVVLS